MKYNIILIFSIIFTLTTPALSAFPSFKNIDVDKVESPEEVFQGCRFSITVKVKNKGIFNPDARVIAYLKGEEPSSVLNQIIGISDWKKINKNSEEQFIIECIINDPISCVSQGKIGFRIQTNKFLTKIWPFDGYPCKLIQKIWPNLFFDWKTNITIINPINIVGKLVISEFNIKKYENNSNNGQAESVDNSLVKAKKLDAVEDKPVAYIKIENKALYSVTLKIRVGILEPSIFSFDTFGNSIIIGEGKIHIEPEKINDTIFSCDIPDVTKTGTYTVVYNIVLLVGEDEIEFPILTNNLKDRIWIDGTTEPIIEQIEDLISEKTPYISFFIIAAVIAAAIGIHIIKGSGGIIWEKMKKKK